MTTPIERIRAYHRELTEIRRDLHAHPELSFTEQRTSGVVANTCASLASKPTPDSRRPASWA